MGYYVAIEKEGHTCKPTDEQIKNIKLEMTKDCGYFDRDRYDYYKRYEFMKIVELVGEKGYSFIPANLVGGRKKEHFRSIQIFMLDFDRRKRHIIRNYQNVSVSAYMSFWMEEDIKKRCRQQTYYSFSNVVRKHILPELGGKKMSALTAADIQTLYNKKIEYSYAVSKQIKAVIGLSMRYAVEMKVIANDPSAGVRLRKKGKNTGYHLRSIDERKTLSLEQIQQLIECSRNTPIYMMVLFNVLMGLQRSEIIALKYSDLDQMHRTICIQRQLGKKSDADQGKYEFGTITKQEVPTKTRSSVRTLPVPDYVFEAILAERTKHEENHKKYGARFENTGYICCSKYGKPRSAGYHWKYYKQLLRENNLPDIRWHDLRSTYCTLLLKNDFSPKAVSQMMGHSKEIITVDVYGDQQEIISDGVPEIEAFMKEVLPEGRRKSVNEHIDVVIDIAQYIDTGKEPE